jgi:predicted esterase
MKYAIFSMLLLFSFQASSYAAGDKKELDYQAEFDKKARVVQLKQIKDFTTIAKKCLKDKHYSSARFFHGVAVRYLEKTPDAKYKITLAKLDRDIKAGEDKVAEGSEKFKYETFINGSKGKKLNAKYNKSSTSSSKNAVKALVRILKWAQKEKFEEGIKQSCELIVDKDHDNKDARKILNHSKIDFYGWVGEEEAAAAKAGKVKFQDKWVTKEEVAEKKGPYDLTFNLSFKEFSREYIYIRYGLRKIPKPDYHHFDIKIKEEGYYIYVPESYTGKEPYGIFVNVQAGNGGGMPNSWKAVCDAKKMIVVSAHKSGNNEDVIHRRVPLAIAGLLNGMHVFNIDPKRLIIAGVSGGGRVASGIAVTYPDLFTGALYTNGCNGVSRWGGMTKDKKLVELIKNKMRYCIFNGSDDFNKEGSLAVQREYKQLGFKHVTHIEQPGLKHSSANPEYFTKCLDWLDGK